jgi:hypothetical protein
MNEVSNTGSTGNQQLINSEDDKRFQERATATLLNFSTSNADVVRFVMQEMNDPNLSEGRLMALRELLTQRSQQVSFLSNLSRMFFDTGNQIIRNLRV